MFAILYNRIVHIYLFDPVGVEPTVGNNDISTKSNTAQKQG